MMYDATEPGECPELEREYQQLDSVPLQILVLNQPKLVEGRTKGNIFMT